MGSPITLSGFNNIDFGSIVTALMAQERIPEQALQQKQTDLKNQSANLSTLSTKLSTLDGAARALGGASSLVGTSFSNTDSAAVTVAGSGTTPPGTYDIVVNELARAQVTASTPAVLDPSATVVASGGTLTIGGKDVTLTGDTTLQGLADAINGTPDIGVSATVTQTDSTHYSLVLTGTQTGQANAFSITNGLTGGTVAFGASSVPATDASITVNNVVSTSSTNTFSSAVFGATLTVQRKDPTETVTVTVNADTTAGKQLVTNFVTAYNDLAAFQQSQQNASNNGDTGSLGHEAILRSVTSSIRGALGDSNSADSSYQYLASVGIGFARDGTLTFNTSDFDTAAATTGGLAHIQTLFAGTSSTAGIFDTVHDGLSSFTAVDGLLAAAQEGRTANVASLTDQIADFEARLAVRETSLRAQFTAADAAMSQLTSQGNSLTSLNSQYRLF